jgi:molybdopterin synthase catalytic subunit/molybdopterin converting factor small subunit
MRVRVLFFGLLKDVAGRASDAVELGPGATVAELLRHYEREIPRLTELLPSVALSVNQEYAGPEMELKANDEVGLLPPVSGGTGEKDGQQIVKSRAAIVRDAIDSRELLKSIQRPDDGAGVIFEGVVRNNTRGRETRFLEYEAYEEMALKQMETLAAQALAQFAVRDVALVHRLGRLEIGEASVIIAVASAHRGPAFDACRWLIDTLKKTVPIWKKEFFVDGAVWADGEPFPAEIPRAEGSPSERTASK